jgi:hypothetical protein
MGILRAITAQLLSPPSSFRPHVKRGTCVRIALCARLLERDCDLGRYFPHIREISAFGDERRKLSVGHALENH